MRILDTEQGLRPVAVIGQRLAPREFVTHELRAVDARPVGHVVQHRSVTAQRETVPGDVEPVDPNRRMFELRLPGNRIDLGIHHCADTRVGCHLIVPVDRHEHAATRHTTAMLHTCDHRAPTARHAREFTFTHAARQRVLWMQIDECFRHMAGELLRLARAGHRVPLVAHPAGIQRQRILVVRRVDRCARWCRDETRLAVRVGIVTITEKTRGTTLLCAVRRQYRPLNGLQRVVTLATECDEAAQIEHTRHITVDVSVACCPETVIGFAAVARLVTIST
ncbi:hypothetical protein R69749_08413 [Paraburkholderia domus]|nr:hypothetical protein R69749_08413 [Paraburkholderia domus]